jgi:hypothetical protein
MIPINKIKTQINATMPAILLVEGLSIRRFLFPSVRKSNKNITAEKIINCQPLIFVVLLIYFSRNGDFELNC